MERNDEWSKETKKEIRLIYIQLLLYYNQTIGSLRITNIYGNINAKRLFKTSHAELILNRLNYVFTFPFMFVIRKLPNVWSYPLEKNKQTIIRYGSQTLVGGLMPKGALKIFDLCNGALKKIQIFQWNLSLHAFLWGWPVILVMVVLRSPIHAN